MLLKRVACPRGRNTQLSMRNGYPHFVTLVTLSKKTRVTRFVLYYQRCYPCYPCYPQKKRLRICSVVASCVSLGAQHATLDEKRLPAFCYPCYLIEKDQGNTIRPLLSTMLPMLPLLPSKKEAKDLFPRRGGHRATIASVRMCSVPACTDR